MVLIFRSFLSIGLVIQFWVIRKYSARNSDEDISKASDNMLAAKQFRAAIG
jgi:hypothetical protein